MEIQENIPLAQYTTFKIGGPARFFCSVTSEDELRWAVASARERGSAIFVLGGGSNILMSDKGFDGLVIKMEIGGIEEGGADTEREGSPDEGVGPMLVSCGAGVQWDTLVEYAVQRGLYGIENLSAIPGTVGAAPVQNIGAYGAEVAQSIRSVRAYDTHTDAFVDMSREACMFSYRDSVFKREKGRYIVTRVDFDLRRQGVLDISYKDVAAYFSHKGIEHPTLAQVRDAVIDIRWNKLPDWKLWGTAGSFFKNPIIAADHFDVLKRAYPELPGFPEPDGRVKVSLGWILDKVCDARGLCAGNACVYEKQALVLVTKPGATSEEVVSLAHRLMKEVKDKTGIDIEGEVEWVN